MILEGVYRRFVPLKGGKGPLDVRLTANESVAVDQAMPANYEATRAGRRMMLAYNGTAPTGVAVVAAFPTTAAQWVIWNADPYKAYVFTQVGLLLFSGTDAIGGFALATIFKAPVQLGANATGFAVMNASGSSIGSNAIIKTAVTITGPATPLWAPVADNLLSAVATLPAASFSNRLVDGRLILPPGQGLGLVAMGPTGTTRAMVPYAEWIEIESDLE
jgi:hypothetical protein